MAPLSPPTLRPLAQSVGLAVLAMASIVSAAADDAGQVVTITGPSAGNVAGVAGFGDVSLARTPVSATVITATQLRDAGIASLGDITRLDAGTTDAYNAPGYWGILAVRGFTLDNRFNYRRDGLPINAETVIPASNKQALELLKGTSGLQAGTSAPGGLVNLVVKRPTQDLTEASVSLSERRGAGVTMDIGRRAVSGGGIGWRLNVEAEHLEPPLRASQGSRRSVAAAVDLPLPGGQLLEAEVEWSRQSQPSTPGFSLLGARLPDAGAVDPRINLNNQTWSLPVVFGATAASIRWTADLSAGWTAVAHAMRQRLRSDDRVAFPFGCSAEDDYTRYCSDGTFDFYDFRSQGERRTSDALDLSARGKLDVGGTTHHLEVGLLRSRHVARFGRQAYNWVGVGSIDGLTQVGADPSLTDENTDRDESSTEWRVVDRTALSSDWTLWAGVRRSSIERRSVRTDGSRPTDYRQTFTTPWLSVSRSLPGGGLAYASWGQGVESEVAPNRPRYANAGQSLPTLKSRQVEIGVKGRHVSWTWNLAVFDIQRPVWSDLGPCDEDLSCTRQADGHARHRGAEGDIEWQRGPWSLRGSALWLHARRGGAADASLNGLQPTNVPDRTVKLQAAYNPSAVPGLALLGFVTHEGRRMVLPDNSVATPGWSRIDLAARYALRLGKVRTVWRLGVDNVADRRAWKEAPYQYEHAYLYPLAPRQWHASVQVQL